MTPSSIRSLSISNFGWKAATRYYVEHEPLPSNTIVSIQLSSKYECYPEPQFRVYDHLQELGNILKKDEFFKSGIYCFGNSDGPRIIMHPQEKCCGNMLVSSIYKKVNIYSGSYNNKVEKAIAMKKCCNTCNAIFHPTHKRTQSTRTYTIHDGINSITSETYFTTNFLDFITLSISIGNTTIEGITDVFNEMSGGNDSVHICAKRLGDAFLLYNCEKIIPGFVYPDARLKHRELDVEELMKSILPKVRVIFLNKSIQHKCDKQGCKDGFIVIDGNEKLYRNKCAAERKDIQRLDKGEPNLVEVCINTPDYKSKYCKEHNEDKHCKSKRLDVSRPMTRNMIKQTESIISIAGECKKDVNILRYVKKTAGMFYGFRPCGYRVFSSEMYTAESLSAVFLSLVDVFGDLESGYLQGIVNDRACGLY